MHDQFNEAFKQSAKLVCLILALTACANVNQTPPKMAGKILWSSHEQRPLWAVTAPKHDKQFFYFVGLSDLISTERSARDSAVLAATAEASRYFFSQIKAVYQRTASGTHNDSEIGELSVEETQELHLLSEQILTKFEQHEWYLEQWELDTTGIGFKAIVLMKLPRQDAEKAYAFARKKQANAL